MTTLYYESELYHHGIKGMKWGVRRFQNKDGSLKPAGEKRYITVAEGMNKAKASGRDAWRKTTTDNGGKLIGKNKSIAIQPSHKAKIAARKSYMDAANKSLKESKDHNKQLKAEKKAESNTPEAKARREKMIKNGAKFAAYCAVGMAAGYGAAKIHKYSVLKKEYNRGVEMGRKYASKILDGSMTMEQLLNMPH